MKVPTYSCLESFINLGVSDVYIADDLCYNLKNVHDICQENNVQMRLILNQVPSMTLDRGINPKAPIFMPKDMDTINPYFDVLNLNAAYHMIGRSSMFYIAHGSLTSIGMVK